MQLVLLISSQNIVDNTIYFLTIYWSLKFYFRWFDYNLRLIAFDFLVNDGIEKIKTEMKRKKTKHKLEVLRNTHVDTLTLKIT